VLWPIVEEGQWRLATSSFNFTSMLLAKFCIPPVVNGDKLISEMICALSEKSISETASELLFYCFPLHRRVSEST
jgi:hypothetical protein